MSSKRSIHTSGEHNIDNIIRGEYGQLSPEDHAEKKKTLAKLNPHLVSLESLKVGDQVYLEDQEEERQEPESSELVPDDIDLSDIPSDTPTEQTVHTPAIESKRKRHASESH